MNSTSRSFHVRAVLTTGGLWQGSVDELPEVTHTHRSLAQLESRLQKKISETCGEPFELVMVTSTGDTAFDDQLTRARDLRTQADDLARQAREAAQPLAKRLTALGVSQRDAGRLLSVSGSLVAAMLSDH
ncbi:hypothetical protein [Streptomyces sp. NPDC047065]|uniref:hypothetical protein n=1 Tax=Streptomyces sp. NPDC047065 TaxID=3154606 RepID=UPI0033E8882D